MIESSSSGRFDGSWYRFLLRSDIFVAKSGHSSQQRHTMIRDNNPPKTACARLSLECLSLLIGFRGAMSLRSLSISVEGSGSDQKGPAVQMETALR